MSGVKFDAGKPDAALLPPLALVEVSKVLSFGRGKYGAFNWTKGIAYTRLVSATMRHLLAWMSGERRDPESGLSHLSHAACNILMLLEFEQTGRADLDDFPQPKNTTAQDSSTGKDT